MKKTVFPLLHILLFLTFLLALIIIGRRIERSIEGDVTYHSEALVPYAWDLDYASMETYLSLVVKNRNYARAAYRDSTSGLTVLSVEGEDGSPLEKFLIRIGLAGTHDLVRPVVYNGEGLGQLTVTFVSRNIFIFAYVFLIYVLIELVLILNLNLVRMNESLEERIALRTEDLEKEVTARRRAEDDLRLILDSIGEGVIATDREGGVLRMNPPAQFLTGWSNREARGKPLNEILVCTPEEGSGRIDPLGDIWEKGFYRIGEGQNILRSRKGEEYRISESGNPLRSESGEVIGAVIVFRDVTQEHRLRLQLEHGQRMEAVGQLAGGIAHDFNNMLGGVIGSAELIRPYLEGNSEGEELVNLILETGERAAQLTGQLLTFSRKQKLVHSPVDFHGMIEKTAVLLKRTIAKNVEIRTELKAKVSLVSGDPAMLQNCLLNLGINSSHAMPDGGILTISTGNLELDELYCRNSPFELEPAAYIEIRVEDTGAGIPAGVLPRIFEPFFTTKGKSRDGTGGTGLGLSAVYGTVQQHHGELKVYSELGRGTVFRMLFPLTDQSGTAEASEAVETVGAGETILLIDDEESIRLTAGKILEALGYRILSARDGREGLELYREKRDQVRLVLLDMIMPRMNGQECFHELRKLTPDLPVIMASGFSNAEDVRNLRENGLNAFITKPYRMKELGQLIGEILRSPNLPS